MKIYNTNLIVNTILKNRGSVMYNNNDAVYIFDDHDVAILKLTFQEWKEFKLVFKPILEVTEKNFGYIMTYKN